MQKCPICDGLAPQKEGEAIHDPIDNRFWRSGTCSLIDIVGLKWHEIAYQGYLRQRVCLACSNSWTSVELSESYLKKLFGQWADDRMRLMKLSKFLSMVTSKQDALIQVAELARISEEMRSEMLADRGEENKIAHDA
jgi:hypothetical protein